MAPNLGTNFALEHSITRETTKRKKKIKKQQIAEEECPLLAAFFTFLSYGVLLFVGYLKEFFFPPSNKEKNREGYVPLYVGFESFYTRNVYRRIQHCWNRPICSVPGAEIDLLERSSFDNGWIMEFTGRKQKCINAGSYNYLGFAENSGSCHDAAAKATKELGVASSSSRLELGSSRIIENLELLVANFLKVDAAITFAMGFATNVLNLPALLGPGCLVISDEYNHASLILGIKISGTTVKVFQHNNYNHLEYIVRQSIIHGHPRTRRAWRKIVIVMEGIYSMEGTICDLPRLISLKKKYKTYLYVDEAHSIGALGPNGGGVVDYYGVDPSDIDILMGTFTKSFGSAGGYIAGPKELINYLRVNSDAQSYAMSMSPPVCQQILTSMNIIMGNDNTNEGEQKLKGLNRKTRYFRQGLQDMGYIVIGDQDAPIVPILIFVPSKVVIIVNELTKRNIAGVGVGFPATKITGARMRFCLSASHTKQMLDEILKALDEIGDLVNCKYSRRPRITTNEVIEW